MFNFIKKVAFYAVSIPVLLVAAITYGIKGGSNIGDAFIGWAGLAFGGVIVICVGIGAILHLAGIPFVFSVPAMYLGGCVCLAVKETMSNSKKEREK